MHVVCVGDVMVDVLAALPGPLVPGSDRPASVAVRGGGAAANVACWLSWAGARASLVCRVGDDALGAFAVAELEAAGVNVVVESDPRRATGVCIVLVDETGERTMVPSAGANRADSQVTRLPASADWLYLSGYTLLDRATRGFALACLDTARERCWSIAVDAASAGPLHEVGPDLFFELVGSQVLLLANADEARELSGLDEPAAAAQALAVRTGQAIVKRGGAGAVWSDGSGVRSVPAPDVPLVDSTGAGDAFAAGFLAGRGDIAESLESGARLAAVAVGVAGARPPRA